MLQDISINGGVPATRYKYMTASWNGQPVALPDTAVTDLFNPNLRSTEIWYNVATATWYITAYNSDGAGGYLVLWAFDRNRFARRYIYAGF